MLAKLRDKVIASRVEEYFAANSADFDTVHVARFLVADEENALELCGRIRNRQVDFLEAAQSRFIAAKQSGQPTVDLFTTFQRREVPAEIRESLFHSEPGSLLGPIRERNGYAIIRVLSTVRATLDDATRDTIKNILFEEWLEARWRTASIEWLWGKASNTAQGARTDVTVNAE